MCLSNGLEVFLMVSIIWYSDLSGGTYPIQSGYGFLIVSYGIQWCLSNDISWYLPHSIPCHLSNSIQWSISGFVILSNGTSNVANWVDRMVSI